MKVNLVGDITGFFESFKALMGQMPTGELWALGDLVDRGPGSKQVLDYFIDGKHNSVMGNHDHMMLFESIRNNSDVNSRLYPYGCWIANGGDETTKSFGFKEWYEFDSAKIDSKYFEFLKNMPLQVDIGALKLTHAPINDKNNKRAFDLKEINKDPYLIDKSILWNRLPPKKMEGKFQVYGHNSSKGILWHTNKFPQGVYMADPFEVPEGAWGVCIDTWGRGYLTGLHIDTVLLADPKQAITVFKQPFVNSDVAAIEEMIWKQKQRK
jgi:hypothetical protein